MDGYTAIRKIRQLEAESGRQPIAVYAVTAHAGLIDAQKCREAGFTERIVKPITRTAVYKTLAEAVRLDVSDWHEAEDGPLPPEYMSRLMPLFLKTRSDDIAKLRTAATEGDFTSIQRLGHKIKGSAASYGFHAASAAGRELERAARSGDLTACNRLIGELDSMFKESPSV
jgi:HPt (histidine-containing phosphotransfer) domain-containing protein